MLGECDERRGTFRGNGRRVDRPLVQHRVVQGLIRRLARLSVARTQGTEQGGDVCGRAADVRQHAPVDIVQPRERVTFPLRRPQRCPLLHPTAFRPTNAPILP